MIGNKYNAGYMVILITLVTGITFGCVMPEKSDNEIEESIPLQLDGYKTLNKLPFNEAWYGMYFQEDKVGYSHFKISTTGRNRPK